MAFPTSPIDGQIYNDYRYNTNVGAWITNELLDVALDNLIAYFTLTGNDTGFINQVNTAATLTATNTIPGNAYCNLNTSGQNNQYLTLDLKQNIGLNWTFAMDVNPDSTATGYYHWLTEESSQNNFAIKAEPPSAGNPYNPYFYSASVGSLGSSVNLVPDSWNKLLVGCDGTTLFIYLNGHNIFNGNYNVTYNYQRFLIGRGLSSAWEYGAMRVANIRIWDRWLINAERHRVAINGFEGEY